MPYRDPGPDVREWDKEQGAVSLRISAGTAKNTKTGEWVQMGLPFGPNPRLILAYLNTEALKRGSPEIDVEKSLTGFVKRIQKRPPTGPEIRAFKDQLSRLATGDYPYGDDHVRPRFSDKQPNRLGLRSAHQGRTPTRLVVLSAPVEPGLFRQSPNPRRAASMSWSWVAWPTRPWPWTSTPGSHSGYTGCHALAAL